MRSRARRAFAQGHSLAFASLLEPMAQPRAASLGRSDIGQVSPHPWPGKAIAGVAGAVFRTRGRRPLPSASHGATSASKYRDHGPPFIAQGTIRRGVGPPDHIRIRLTYIKYPSGHDFEHMDELPTHHCSMAAFLILGHCPLCLAMKPAAGHDLDALVRLYGKPACMGDDWRGPENDPASRSPEGAAEFTSRTILACSEAPLPCRWISC